MRKKMISWIKGLIDKVKSISETGISIGQRVFLLMLFISLAIIAAIVLILMIAGIFKLGLSDSQKAIEGELNRISDKISLEFGQHSMQSLSLAQELANSLENNMNELGVSPENFSEHPDLLEEIISKEYEKLIYHLQVSKSSGVFFILDSTVNPKLANAVHSRAGLYIKNMEPNIVHSSPLNLNILRGFSSIGRNNHINLSPEWSMEFDISYAPYYYKPVEVARLNSNLALSHMYYWSTPFTLKGTSEEIMLCTVPLIDSEGKVFGVCGIEISSMLFKLSYMPNNSNLTRLFCLLSPYNDNTMDLNQSLFSGGYSAKILAQSNSKLSITEDTEKLIAYEEEKGVSFLGAHKIISLYPKGSAFRSEKWIIAIMVPKKDLMYSVTRINVILIVSLTILVFIVVILSFLLSRRFRTSISEAFELIKADKLYTGEKTKIPEIDDLIQHVSTHKEQLLQKAKQEGISLSILDDFVENAKKLSPAERLVFDLYLKNHTAAEIADILYLSINTIKTHSKRIYMKLNINSREELMVYQNLLKEIGKEI